MTLADSYRQKGNQISLDTDFYELNLEPSRALFNFYNSGRAVSPKEMDVLAILAGLPFSKYFRSYIENVQSDLNKITNGSLKYFVPPERLGLELLVLLWPNDNWQLLNFFNSDDFFSRISLSKFRLKIFGFQVHRDGCIIARGFDEGGGFRKLRNQLLADYCWISRRQSEWVHVPIGRFLEPVGTKSFYLLKSWLKSQDTFEVASFEEEIAQIKMVREYQWYMSKFEILKSKPIC